jgi:YVTN family beta-propeller protein
MRNWLFYITVSVTFFYGCQKETLVSPSDPSFSAETFYGVGTHSAAIISWRVTDSYITHVDLYRSAEPEFSAATAVHLGSRHATIEPVYRDTALTDGVPYYYTIIPFHDNGDGTTDHSTNRKTITVIPRNVSALSGDQIVYSEHIQPLFTNGCAVGGCHAAGGGDGDHTVAGSSHSGSRYSLASWSDAVNGTDDVAQIVPFRASKSHLIRHLNSDTTVGPVSQPSMPPGFSFPAELRDMLIRWIDHGARYDDGSIAFSAVPERGWGYVTNQGEDLTAVIDLDRNRIARYITTGTENPTIAPLKSPHNAAVDWQNQYFYINLIAGNALLKFKVSDNSPAGSLTTGLHSPAQVALSQNGDTAYVTNFEESRTNITIVHTPTMTAVADVGSPAMLKPHGISITPDFRHILVMNSFSDNITIVRTSDNTIVKTVPVSGSVPALPIGYLFRFEPYQAAITPDSKFAYITCRKSGEVRVLDITQMTIVDSITVGSAPLIPAITPGGGYVFVANRNSNSLSAINTATRQVEYTIDNVGVEPHGVAVSKDGKYLYVSCENLGVSDPPHHPTVGGKKIGFVKVIDIAERKVVASMEVGNYGSGMAVTH